MADTQAPVAGEATPAPVPVQDAPVVDAPEETFAAYRARRTADPAAPKEPSAPAEPQAGESKTAPATEPENKQEPNEHGKDDDLPAGVQKRIQKAISKAVAAQREAERLQEAAERRLAELQAPKPDKTGEPAQSSQGAPKEEDFATYPEYMRAVAKYELKQEREAEARAAAERAAAEQRAALQETWNEREAAVMAKYDDFEEVAESVRVPQDSPQTRVLFHALQESEAGPELLYHLGKHPDTVKELMRLSPARLVMRLGQIEAELTKPSTPEPKPKVTAAPKPPTRVGGGAAPSDDTSSAETHEEYVRRRRKQLDNR